MQLFRKCSFGMYSNTLFHTTQDKVDFFFFLEKWWFYINLATIVITHCHFTQIYYFLNQPSKVIVTFSECPISFIIFKLIVETLGFLTKGQFQHDRVGQGLTLIGMREGTFPPCPFWVLFCQLSSYPKFPNFFGGENWYLIPSQAH